jgi:hypothetical protein
LTKSCFVVGKLGVGEESTIQTQIKVTASRVAFALLIAYCIIGASSVIVRSAQLLHNPWENTYFESPQTYAAIYGAQTGKLYIPMSEPPYTLQAYAPLYYAIDVCVARLAHLNVDLFILYARLISYAAFFLCGLLVYLVCRTAAIPMVHSILAALMMMGQPDFLGWNVTPRPDMLFILAMMLSLYCAMRWEDHTWRGYGLAGLFAGIAFLIKQPGLAVAGAIFAALIFQKQFKKAAVLTISTIAPVALTFCILYWRQDPFLQQITFVGKSIWSVADTVHLAHDHLLAGYWIVPAGIGVLGFWQAIKLGSKPKMIASFALVNLLMGFATLPQIGGYVNYLLPGLVGCALLLPYAIEMMREHVRLVRPLVLAGAALVWATSAAYGYDKNMANYYVPPTQTPLTWVRPFRVLSDLTTLNVHGREPNLLDPFGAHVLELTGHWDSTPVVENLNRGDYDLIVLTRVNYRHFVPSFRGISYFSPREIRTINDKYEVLCSTLTRMVLKPRGREVPATPEMFSEIFNQPCGTGFRRVPLDLKLAPDAQ